MRCLTYLQVVAQRHLDIEKRQQPFYTFVENPGNLIVYSTKPVQQESRVKILHTILFILVLSVVGVCGARKDLSEYLAGMQLLAAAGHVSNEEIAVKYRQLVALTGIDHSEAARLINDYKGNPEQWKRIQEMITALIEEGSDTNNEKEQRDGK